MLILVSYDISTLSIEGRKRLRKIAQVCSNHGIRVQNSVFECHLDNAQFRLFKKKMEEIINPEVDSIRFYNLGNHYFEKTIHVGTKQIHDINTPIIL